ncbi:MAG TPA: bacterial transcriptional activator domain-containing protein [Candidatus Limnocylindria bacterium]|jgi:hypothetical protein|nr:bacterial transcriptional activator domain-containing protein [Candidatus Limnocylindria bacterium]
MTDPLAQAAPSVPQTGSDRSDLDALKDGAAMMIQAGNNVAALALLWSAVAMDPTDLAAHRGLAATLARAGDIDGAADEYARYIDVMLPLGEVGRATLELSFGASVLGGHAKLHEAAEKVVTAVRSIVPQTSTPIAPYVPERQPAAPAMRPIAPASPPAPFEITAPLPAPRLLAKVPFRFCVHADGDRHWMQLEGGTAELVPVAVRVIDTDENVIETRLCIPLAPGDKGHAPRVGDDGPGVAWVVVGIPDDVAAALDAGKPSPYRFQAKVDDEWLSLDLADTGCRLGHTRAKTAAS